MRSRVASSDALGPPHCSPVGHLSCNCNLSSHTTTKLIFHLTINQQLLNSTASLAIPDPPLQTSSLIAMASLISRNFVRAASSAAKGPRDTSFVKQGAKRDPELYVRPSLNIDQLDVAPVCPSTS